MALEIDDTHAPTGLLKLVPPFWGKPRMAALLVVLLEEVQALEDAIWTVIDGLDVDTCNRWVLEQLATIVGEPSRPADDDTLRVLVKGRIAANRSDGTAAALRSLVDALTTGTTQLLEQDDEIKILQLAAPDPLDADAAATLLDAAAAGGTAAAWLTGAGAGSFALPDYGGTTDDSRCMGTGTWSDYHG